MNSPLYREAVEKIGLIPRASTPPELGRILDETFEQTGKIVRELTDDEIAWKREATATYQALAQRSLANLQPAEPLAAVEPGRKRFDKQSIEPRYIARDHFKS